MQFSKTFVQLWIETTSTLFIPASCEDSCTTSLHAKNSVCNISAAYSAEYCVAWLLMLDSQWQPHATCPCHDHDITSPARPGLSLHLGPKNSQSPPGRKTSRTTWRLSQQMIVSLTLGVMVRRQAPAQQFPCPLSWHCLLCLARPEPPLEPQYSHWTWCWSSTAIWSSCHNCHSCKSVQVNKSMH